MSKRHTITASCFDKAGNRLSVATNSYEKSHPIQSHFARLSGNPERIYLHAEVAALLKCGTKRPHTIVVTRYDAKGFPALAKPCPICDLAIKHWNVQEVIHT